MSPKISIITPSFNQGSFLEETILSVHRQTYPNFEHLIIDGGSSDDSVDIIKKHQDKFAFWISEPDKGQADAINKGIQHSTGEILIWINSDDLLEPDALFKAVNCFEKNPSALLIHGKSILFGNGKKPKIIGELKNDMNARYLAYIPFPQPSCFFRRSLITASGPLDTSLHYGMDYELVIRAALSGNLIFCNEILSRYRLHAESKTNRSLEFAREWNITFSKLLRSFSFTKEWIHSLKDYRFYNEGEDAFVVTKNFSPEEIKKATLYHLLIQVHYHYNAGKSDTVNQLCELIQMLSTDFYRENNLFTMKLKNKLLRRGTIEFFRKFSRN